MSELNLDKIVVQSGIRQHLKQYRGEIIKYEVLIDGLQEMCAHPDATGIARSDTGNYDPSQDCYWVEAKCPDCGKRWRVGSEDPEYRTIPREGEKR